MGLGDIDYEQADMQRKDSPGKKDRWRGGDGSSSSDGVTGAGSKEGVVERKRTLRRGPEGEQEGGVGTRMGGDPEPTTVWCAAPLLGGVVPRPLQCYYYRDKE